MDCNSCGGAAAAACSSAPPPRRFVGRRAADSAAAPPPDDSPGAVAVVPPPPRRVVHQQVPREVLEDSALNAAIAALPANYNFEVHKTVWRLRSAGAACVALQFPEGLLLYACALADIFQTFAGVEHCLVLGDVTYGACCVDDLSAAALGATFLVHYGHSCLVPVDATVLPCLYVFVDIAFDAAHLLACVRAAFPPGTRLALAGTIQFGSTLAAARAALAGEYPALALPQAKPLSPGEVLGCTAPAVPPATQAALFIADGRFHLEALMVANPGVPHFRYDPFARALTAESYDHAGMRAQRRGAVLAARGAAAFALVLGTLGRQGNPAVLAHLEARLAAAGRPYTVLLLSELKPAVLAQLAGVDAFVQIACPRLSIDWGAAFRTPVLTPYELEVALGHLPGWWERPGPRAGLAADDAGGAYPMDYYAREGGPHTSSWRRSVGPVA